MSALALGNSLRRIDSFYIDTSVAAIAAATAAGPACQKRRCANFVRQPAY